MALSPAEKQARYRAKKRAQGTVVTEDQRQRAERIVAAQETARVTIQATISLQHAFDAGRAARLFEEIAQGQSGGEEALVAWVRTNPPALWLFYRHLTSLGLWGHWEAWSASRLT